MHNLTRGRYKTNGGHEAEILKIYVDFNMAAIGVVRVTGRIIPVVWGQDGKAHCGEHYKPDFNLSSKVPGKTYYRGFALKNKEWGIV